jgi:hypothetical protein
MLTFGAVQVKTPFCSSKDLRTSLQLLSPRGNALSTVDYSAMYYVVIAFLVLIV